MKKMIIIIVLGFALQFSQAQNYTLQFFPSLDSCVNARTSELQKNAKYDDWQERKCRCSFRSDSLIELGSVVSKDSSVELVYRGEKKFSKDDPYYLWDLMVDGRWVGDAQLIYIEQMNHWLLSLRTFEKISTNEVFEKGISFTDRFLLADSQWKATKVIDTKSGLPKLMVILDEEKNSGGEQVLFYKVHEKDFEIMEVQVNDSTVGAIIYRASKY